MALSSTYINKIENSAGSSLLKMNEFLGILSELTKFRITFFVSVTTFVGYILQSGRIDFSFIFPTLGVLILACGASALNEYQERNIDSKMERTINRPIPSNRISKNQALFISLLLILFGSIILFLSSVPAFILGIFTLFWYNGIYTPIKKFTAFAIIPGSLVGALPPVIGWIAAGGNLFDQEILAFSVFMFIWQIPHFWLLMLMYDDQYKKAGFPTLSNIFSNKLITKITFAWIVILLFSSILFYFSGITVSYISNGILLAAGIVTAYYSYRVISKSSSRIFKKSFLLINSYVLFVLIVISIENII